MSWLQLLFHHRLSWSDASLNSELVRDENPLAPINTLICNVSYFFSSHHDIVKFADELFLRNSNS